MCARCGGRLSFDPEPKRRAKRDVCHCGMLPYPHRIRTEPWCFHAVEGPTEDDWRDRHKLSYVQDADGYRPEWDKEQDWGDYVFDPIDADDFILF